MTTHADPTYVVDGATHYCVGNMPGVVPHTPSYALVNATSQHALGVANLGWRRRWPKTPTCGTA